MLLDSMKGYNLGATVLNDLATRPASANSLDRKLMATGPLRLMLGAR